MAGQIIRPRVAIRYGRQNEPVRIPWFDLLVDPPAQTFLTADAAAGATTLTVKSVIGFTAAGIAGNGKNILILVGEPGTESSEVIQTDGTTIPSGTTITATTVFAHSAGTKVYIINWNQVEISTATTTGGTKTVIATIALQADWPETLYNDTTARTGFYFARFKETVTNTFSPYSDACPVGGYGLLSARYIIDNALNRINKKSNELYSDEFGFMMLNDFQNEVVRERKRWSWLQVFDFNLGNLGQGTYKIAVPTDLDDQNTNKGIWNLRMGVQQQMTWVDKNKWNELLSGVAHTTLAATLNINDTTITLTASNDFPDTGTVQITTHTYTYTANNRTTGVLTITAAATSEVNGADVFLGASEAQPIYWTTFGGFFYVYPIVGSQFPNRNFYVDYYKSLTNVTLDSDVIVVPDTNAAQFYLCWAYLVRENNGKETPEAQVFRNLFEQRLKRLVQKEALGRTFVLSPRMNDFSKQMQGFGDDAKQIRLGNFTNLG